MSEFKYLKAYEDVTIVTNYINLILTDYSFFFIFYLLLQTW